MMRPLAVVFGGSGFIGTHLVRRLAKEGNYAVASVDIAPPREIIDEVSYYTHDVRDLSQFRMSDKVDIIFNLSAVHTTPGHQPWEYYDTNIRGAREVVNFALRNDTKEIIFTSSISVYGPSEGRKTEASTPMPISDYGRSKLMAESMHRDWALSDSKRKLVIARPAVVFGRGERGNFTRMAQMLNKGIFIFPGRRDTVKSCIYVDDLIDAFAIARSSSERLIIFNGAFPERYTIEQIVLQLKSTYYPRAMTIDLPYLAVAGSAYILGKLGGQKIGLHPDRVTKLIKSTDVYPDWLVKHGWAPVKGLESGFARWAEESETQFD